MALLSLRTIYMARWNTSNYWYDTLHFIQVFRSTDGGYTWEFTANVGHNGQGYITSDFGLGLTRDPNTGALYMITLCHYYEHTPFVGLEVFKSEDGGYTWRSVHVFGENYTYDTYDYATADIAYDPFRNRLIAYYFKESTNDIGVAISSDGGYSWQEISRLPIYPRGEDIEGKMEVGPNGEIWIADWFGAYPECWVSTDGGYTWNGYVIDYSLSQSWASARSVGLAYLPPYLYALVWSTSTPAYVYRSDDGGRTWTKISAIIQDPATEDGSCALAAQYSWLYAVFWDARYSSVVFRSTDGGISWAYMGSVPRQEPWYEPASAIALAVDILPLEVSEGETAEKRLKAIGGKNNLTVLYTGTVEIYNAQGRLLLKSKIPGKASFALPGGVYLVIGEGGARAKALVIP